MNQSVSQDEIDETIEQYFFQFADDLQLFENYQFGEALVRTCLNLQKLFSEYFFLTIDRIMKVMKPILMNLFPEEMKEIADNYS